MQKVPTVDFRETRPPRLSTDVSVEDPTMKIERLTFFGWVWEPYHSLRVTGASKDDKSGIYLRLWAFGGDTIEMEIARFAISKFLLQCRRRRFYLEYIRWLKNQDRIEYDINVADLYDDLMRVMHSSWR